MTVMLSRRLLLSGSGALRSGDGPLTRLDVHNQDAVAIEAKRHIRQGGQRSDEHAGGDNQHERQSHLRHDETAGDTTRRCSAASTDEGKAPRERTCRRARDASCRTAAGDRPTTDATSSNGMPNRSCSTNDVRSGGDSVSSTTSSA